MEKILVVKMGSSSVTRGAGPDDALLRSALAQAVAARHSGWRVVLVSSGAVSSGAAYLAQFGHTASRRLAAAVGQPLLMNLYASPVTDRPHVAAQILVSQGDLRSATQMRVLADVLRDSFDNRVIPIVNGNDVIDPDGSDNDSVATGIAVAVGADKLLLLTDVDGVFAGAPGSSDMHAELPVGDLRSVPVARSGTGRGGMGSKLRAAELAAHNGISTVIANARQPAVITACIDGEPVGTAVTAVSAARAPDKRWIAGIARAHGTLVINRDAELSIVGGSSLFASGIKRVLGTFAGGDVIDITAPDGRLIARGGARVSSSLLSLVRAMKSDEVGTVMAEVISEYARLEQPELPLSAAGPWRPPVAKALQEVRGHSPAAMRKLAVELLTLFPQTAVRCMTDIAGQDSRLRLAASYERLSSDLSFVDRSRLVVF